MLDPEVDYSAVFTLPPRRPTVAEVLRDLVRNDEVRRFMRSYDEKRTTTPPQRMPLAS